MIFPSDFQMRPFCDHPRKVTLLSGRLRFVIWFWSGVVLPAEQKGTQLILKKNTSFALVLKTMVFSYFHITSMEFTFESRTRGLKFDVLWVGLRLYDLFSVILHIIARYKDTRIVLILSSVCFLLILIWLKCDCGLNHHCHAIFFRGWKLNHSGIVCTFYAVKCEYCRLLHRLSNALWGSTESLRAALKSKGTHAQEHLVSSATYKYPTWGK